MTRSECQELMFANQNLERMSAKEETRLKEVSRSTASRTAKISEYFSLSTL